MRPDPQAIWATPPANPAWKRPDARYLRSQTGGGHWEKKALPESWKIRYRDLTFQVKPMNFKHTGLFPEQAVNWDFAMEKIRSAGRPVSVLNLFAYTGGATVACAKAGASVCHVDAAKGMVAWARENAKLSGLEDAPIRWIVDDCAKFVEREIRRGRRYDAIIMDPPSYGRGPGGEVWKLEDNLYPFVKLCAGVLSDRPLFVIINSYTTGLAPSVLGYLLHLLVAEKYGGAAPGTSWACRSRRRGWPCPAAPRPLDGGVEPRRLAHSRRQAAEDGNEVDAMAQIIETKELTYSYPAEEGEEPLPALPGRGPGHRAGQLRGGAGPQRLRQVHPGQDLQRRAAAHRWPGVRGRHGHRRRGQAPGHPPDGGHGVPEPGQPDRGQRGGGGRGLRPGEPGGPHRRRSAAGWTRPCGGGHGAFARHAPHLLSGGQKQRIAIAGVIAMEPACIVLDEATAMLDPVGRREVLSAVHRLNRERGTTVVLITHHMNEAEDADRVVVMDDGKVAMDGAPREIFTRVEELRAMGLTVPDTVDLLDRLKKDGWDVPLDALTAEDCADAVFAAGQQMTGGEEDWNRSCKYSI